MKFDLKFSTLLTRLGLLCLLLIAGISPAPAAGPPATVAMLTGEATASRDTDVRKLAKGDAVGAGEVINTGPNSYLNLKFADGSFTLLRPNSRFVIEAFKFDPPPQPAAAAGAPAPLTVAPPPGESNASLRVLKGGLRAVSGLVGKEDRAEYRMSTPVATIGIRGTDYLAVICDAACAADPVLREGMPAGEQTEGGLIVGVYHGAIAVDTGHGCDGGDGPCIVREGEFLLVTRDGKVRRLSGMPHFLTIDAIPDPTRCEQ